MSKEIKWSELTREQKLELIEFCDSLFIPPNLVKDMYESGAIDYEFIEKEKIESEIAVFWDLFSKILPKSRARCEIGDEKLFIAFKATFIEVRKFYKNKII